MAQPFATRVYSAGRRWIWIVQEFGHTVCSGTAIDRVAATDAARVARKAMAATTPGGMVKFHKYPGKRL